MPSLKDVKLQIAGVRKTKQITRAMGMVASASLRGAQNKIERFKPYAQKFDQMLSDLAARTEEAGHPLLEVHEKQENVLILLITSDRGLCGGFNANLIGKALKLARSKQEENKKVQFICIGRKGRDAVKKTSFEILQSMTDVMKFLNFNSALQLGNLVSHAYENYEADEVYIVFSEFVSMARQVATAKAILPIDSKNDEQKSEDNQSDKSNNEEKVGNVEYIYEPNVATLLSELLPRYLNVVIYRGLLDTNASEHAARMLAMNNATNNCDDMIGSLTLLFNKTRQAAITSDLMDIVGGANALQSQ